MLEESAMEVFMCSSLPLTLSWCNILDDQDVYQRLGCPVTAKVRVCSGQFNNMVSAPENLVDGRISQTSMLNVLEKSLLVDFGQSFMLQTPPSSKIGMTMSSCAPQVIFESKLFGRDIWALGCTIF
ncbi:hypothetical protein V1523DRAFT_420336 [Lipomyces doorenjongii]